MFVSLIIRPLVLIFAAIVLGLSVRAAKWQMFESVPANTTFAAFAGGFTLLTSLVGIASIWITAIPALVMSMVDSLAAVILLAAGVAFAIKIPGADCADEESYTPSGGDLLSGGCKTIKGYSHCGIEYEADMYGAVLRRCSIIKSDTAFLFIAFAACLGAAAVSYIAHKRGHSF